MREHGQKALYGAENGNGGMLSSVYEVATHKRSVVYNTGNNLIASLGLISCV